MSTKWKRTPWFDGWQQPARPGVYERNCVGWFSRWDGRNWFLGSSLKVLAAAETVPLKTNHDPWRGLAADPSPAGHTKD